MSMPRIAAAAASASSGEWASLTPPALPRPPVFTCAFTTTVPPIFSAAARASAGVSATIPASTGTPCASKRSRAWYSNRSTALRPSVDGHRAPNERSTRIVTAPRRYLHLERFAFRRPGPVAVQGPFRDNPDTVSRPHPVGWEASPTRSPTKGSIDGPHPARRQDHRRHRARPRTRVARRLHAHRRLGFGGAANRGARRRELHRDRPARHW